jgi:hypothetical protein
VTEQEAVKATNAFMIGFDLWLGTSALLAPATTLRILGHDHPSEDAEHLFRRNAPIWLTFAAAHALAARRGRPQDWNALAWLRATEWMTDVIWSRSPAVTRPGAKAGLVLAGAANAAMSLGFARMARSRGSKRRFVLRR